MQFISNRCYSQKSDERNSDRWSGDARVGHRRDGFALSLERIPALACHWLQISERQTVYVQLGSPRPFPIWALCGEDRQLAHALQCSKRQLDSIFTLKLNRSEHCYISFWCTLCLVNMTRTSLRATLWRWHPTSEICNPQIVLTFKNSRRDTPISSSI